MTAAVFRWSFVQILVCGYTSKIDSQTVDLIGYIRRKRNTKQIEMCRYMYAVILSIQVIKDTLQMFTWQSICRFHLTDGHLPQLCQIFVCTHMQKVGRYSDTLRAGWSRDWVLMGARFYSPIQIVPWAHPGCCTMVTVSLSQRQSGRGVALTTHPHLVPRLKKE